MKNYVDYFFISIIILITLFVIKISIELKDANHKIDIMIQTQDELQSRIDTLEFTCPKCNYYQKIIVKDSDLKNFNFINK